jgi:DNA-binding response OmpR family regulator
VKEGFFKLIIRDSGIGIKKEERDKIFEQFYRGEKSKNMEKSGFGLGLTIVSGLVNAYHGSVDIESTEGEGTEFSIVLPYDKRYFSDAEIESAGIREKAITLDLYDLEQDDAYRFPGEVSPEDPNGREYEDKPVLMIVEDDKDLRAHLRSRFSEYNVYEAVDGQDAVRKIDEVHPDIIISDVRMPGIDGFELCERLKTNESTSHIPVVLLTAKVTDEDKIKGLSTGADAYITKPFDTKVLKTTVLNLLDSRKQLKEKYSKSITLEPTDISITSVDEKFLKRAIEIVEEHISDPDYSVDLFSKEIGMSRSHLHRKFVGLSGLSPSGFIRTLRMKRAAQLLTKGQLTVSEILYEVGIKSRSYFIKSFREQFGMSPTDFAQNIKNNKSEMDPD